MSENAPGCAVCFGEDAVAVWTHLRELQQGVVTIVDESHFMVRIVGCATCGQRFASIFCERVNWAGGDDSMDSFLLPLSAAEAEALIAAGEAGVEGALRALHGERRQLVSFFPRPANHSGKKFVTGSFFLPRHD